MQKEQEKTEKTVAKKKSSKQLKNKTTQTEKVKKLSYEERKALKLKAQQEKSINSVEPANKDRFYCTNKELTAELIKWRDSAKKPEDRILSEELGKMLMAMSQKVLNRSEFRNYPKALKEDMSSFFYYKAIRGLKNYDFKFNNPFAWLTQCAFNGFLTVLKKHYKHINIKKELMTKLLLEMETYPGMNAAASLNKCIKAYIDDGESND